MTDTDTTHRLTRGHLRRFSHAALHRFLAMDAAERPIDRKTTAAEFRGICVTADVLGLANTPDHMHIMVMDSVREAEPRPAYKPMGNDEQKAWDDRVAGRIAYRIQTGDIS